MATTSAPRSPSPGISRGLTLLFAVAGGIAVANLYWAQPLLREIAISLHVAPAAAGLLVTLTQIGYAVGVFLIVPLGDTVNRRRLIPAMMFTSAIALAASGFAPTFSVLLVTLAAVGMTTVAAQMLTPLAGDLADDAERGRVVGTISSGVLIGILASRTLSGLVAGAFGWRAIYLVAAVATATAAALLARSLPAIPPRATSGYPQLLRSVFAIAGQSRAGVVTLLISAINVGVFTLFWTALTFLLSSPPYEFSVSQIGLVGLAGLAGAIAARRAGRLHDRGFSTPATGIALTVAAASLALVGLGSGSLTVVLIAVLVFDVAIQAVNVLNQTRLLSLAPHARSRMNTAFITSNFIGAAIGSALASALWATGGWSAVTAGGVVLLLLALAGWALGRQSLIQASPYS